jgi:integrase
MPKLKTVIRKYENLQFRQRQRGKSLTFFLAYTLDGARIYETLKTVPVNLDKAQMRDVIAQCEEIARKRDSELAQGIAGAQYIAVKNKSFLTFAEHVQRSKRTPDLYRKALLKFRKFLSTQGKSDITFGELSPAIFLDFRQYLLNEVQQGMISSATASKYLAKVKHFINEAMKRELLARNPFLSVPNIKATSPEREFLTLSELETLMRTPLPKTLRYDAKSYANFFIFSCLTGVRPTDVRELTFGNVQTRNGVDYELVFSPSKTRHTSDKLLIVPLHPLALRIIQEQKERLPNATLNDKIFTDFPPRTSPNALNAFLKQWLKAAGISKRITSYCARHTFASNLLLSGAGILEVSRLLGHASLRHTQTYSHLTDFAKRAAVMRLAIHPTAEN